MKGSFENGEVVIRMSFDEANCLSNELFYTIDHRDDEYPDYALLQGAVDQALRGWVNA